MAEKVVAMIDNKIKNIKNNLALINADLSNSLEESLKDFSKSKVPKDTLELVDTLDVFLTSMSEKDIKNLKLIFNNKKDKYEKLDSFLDEFNKVSPFTQLNSEHIIEQKFKTAGGGKPDTVIVRKLDNGKTKYFYSAASHSPDTPFEDMQLFVQPMKLKLAIDKIKDIEDINSLLVENYAEQEQIYKKSNTYEIFEYIDENIDEIIDDKIDFFEDLEINGTFSHPDIKIVKNIPQKQIYKGLAKKYKESMEEEIQKRSQWLFIVGQLATGYDKINLYAEYTDEEKEKHKSNLTKVIDKVLSKITYPNQTLLNKEPIQEVKEEDIQFNNMNTVFDEKFLSEESIIEFLDLIIDKTKPYTFVEEKSRETVTRKQSVLNTKKIITSFALSSSYISNKFNGNEEIQNKLQKIADITELTTIDLLFKAKSEADFKVS